ncbi:RNA polymerase sigma-70 factor [Zhouia sp. PK063]|uniref:RNA polymerase sigma-70 factor n=1 Tax=Zhouia sp. PK063 TaxID=3373602 RepID=UPI0037982963
MNKKANTISFIATEFTDRNLFQSIALGNYEAMDVLFNKYYHKLCRFGLLYEDDMYVIEEKVADVFMQLWNNRHTLTTIENPKSYIYVIVKNSLRKITQKEKFRQEIDEQTTAVYGMSSPSVEEEIIDMEQKEINKNLIKDILKDMPKKSRQIFEMSRIDGFKYKEISELLHISPKTVENHIAIALKYISKGLLIHKKN